MDLTIFSYEQKQLRVIEKDNESWFVARDVCDILGIIQTKTLIERLENEEVSQTPILDSNGRTQNFSIISESGLYSAILRSDKQEAKPFKIWVTKEVLPSIRKTGSYVSPTISNSQIEILMNQLGNIIQQNQETFKRLDEIEEQRKITETENKELKTFKQEVNQFKRFEKLLEIASKKLSHESFSEGITPDGYVVMSDIPLDRAAYNTLIRRTASFYRQLECENPPRNEANRFIYFGKKVAYIVATLNLIMEGI